MLRKQCYNLFLPQVCVFAVCLCNIQQYPARLTVPMSQTSESLCQPRAIRAYIHPSGLTEGDNRGGAGGKRVKQQEVGIYRRKSVPGILVCGDSARVVRVLLKLFHVQGGVAPETEVVAMRLRVVHIVDMVHELLLRNRQLDDLVQFLDSNNKPIRRTIA